MMRIGVVSQDALLRDGVESLLGSVPGVRVLPLGSRQADGPLDALVVLTDELDARAVADLQTLKRRQQVRLIGIPSSDKLPDGLSSLFDAIAKRAAGADGLRKALASVTNSNGHFSRGVREPRGAYRVHPHLTPRESQVAQLVSRGFSNRRIAESIGIQEQSVKNLVSVVMRKLQCENRVQVALQLAGQAVHA